MRYNNREFRGQSIVEGRGSEFLEQMFGKHFWFTHYEEEDWLRFGVWIKKNGVTKSLFTGSLVAYLLYLADGHRLPATTNYFEKQIKYWEKYGAEVMLKYLEEDDFVIRGDLTLKALRSGKVFHTKYEKKYFQDTYGGKFYHVWTYGDMTKKLLDFLRRHGSKIKRVRF